MKRSFLLLEVLISLSLILLCIVPLVVRPLELYRTENELLWEMEGERLADWTYSEIKETLLKNEIPWKKLPDEKKKIGTFPLPDATVSLPRGKPKTIQRIFTLELKKEKEGPKGEVYRFMRVEISFSPSLSKKKRKFVYKVMVRKLLLEQNEKEGHSGNVETL